jgi:Beta-galactosidase/beta-glucuronidase
MSRPDVYVNGELAGSWAYGYNSFFLDVTSLINSGGKDNVLAVRVENLPESSRWYPGAGLYRNVHVIVANKVHIPVWGTQITTPEVSEGEAAVDLKVTVDGASSISTAIIDSKGVKVAESSQAKKTETGFEQNLNIKSPYLWSPEHPNLYYAVTKVYDGSTQTDEYTTRFGVRSIEFVPNVGFKLNGAVRKFRGVCDHHDLGPLGAAVNKAALRHQLALLKDMGCNAIRTSHNMPAPELVELCDEMGFMMMVESFDEWDIGKCRNGYHLYFHEWAEKDMVNMVRHYRNDPSVVLWSIGNEVPSQGDPTGPATAKFLSDICHREDPTRFTTCGMDQVIKVISNGFAEQVDVPGFNYRVNLYKQAYDSLPRKLVLGSETASTLSSRGVYKFPVVKTIRGIYDDHQCSSYDLEYTGWSNLPDDDFALADDYDWEIGQFVWTGFDYLGEPTPYNLMPNHSSMFGIIDLASIPKDRYYLYRSVWRPDVATLHILPHWTWPGREGKVTPVFVYTNYPSAILFVNGKSYGRRTKNKDDNQSRYRLMWNDVVYEPGEVKVIAYDDKGNEAAEDVVRTAGEPDHLELIPDRTEISADGKDLAYVEVRVVDKEGNLCPSDGRLVSFEVSGAGAYRASANGDATCLDLFHLPRMHLFNGRLTAIVQSSDKPGTVTLEASANGVRAGSVGIQVR